MSIDQLLKQRIEVFKLVLDAILLLFCAAKLFVRDKLRRLLPRLHVALDGLFAARFDRAQPGALEDGDELGTLDLGFDVEGVVDEEDGDGGGLFDERFGFGFELDHECVDDVVAEMGEEGGAVGANVELLEGGEGDGGVGRGGFPVAVAEADEEAGDGEFVVGEAAEAGHHGGRDVEHAVVCGEGLEAGDGLADVFEHDGEGALGGGADGFEGVGKAFFFAGFGTEAGGGGSDGFDHVKGEETVEHEVVLDDFVEFKDGLFESCHLGLDGGGVDFGPLRGGEEVADVLVLCGEDGFQGVEVDDDSVGAFVVGFLVGG